MSESIPKRSPSSVVSLFRKRPFSIIFFEHSSEKAMYDLIEYWKDHDSSGIDWKYFADDVLARLLNCSDRNDCVSACRLLNFLIKEAQRQHDKHINLDYLFALAAALFYAIPPESDLLETIIHSKSPSYRDFFGNVAIIATHNNLDVLRNAHYHYLYNNYGYPHLSFLGSLINLRILHSYPQLSALYTDTVLSPSEYSQRNYDACCLESNSYHTLAKSVTDIPEIMVYRYLVCLGVVEPCELSNVCQELRPKFPSAGLCDAKSFILRNNFSVNDCGQNTAHSH